MVYVWVSNKISKQYNAIMYMSVPDHSDRRFMAAAAIVAVTIPAVLPRAAWGPALIFVVAASALTFLYVGHVALSASSSASPPASSLMAGGGGVDGSSSGRGGGERGGGSTCLPPFAPIDPVLYTLRAPSPTDLVHLETPRRALRHLALRRGGKLFGVVRRAALLGARNGNAASGTRVLAALEDFFARYHRALASDDPNLAARTLEVLRDTRIVALNAVEDLAMTVPLALGRPVRTASDAVRSETLLCMATLASKHAPSMSPSLKAGAWAAPLAHDPSRRAGDPHSLY